jgi:hypothetical protein
LREVLLKLSLKRVLVRGIPEELDVGGTLLPA